MANGHTPRDSMGHVGLRSYVALRRARIKPYSRQRSLTNTGMSRLLSVYSSFLQGTKHTGILGRKCKWRVSQNIVNEFRCRWEYWAREWNGVYHVWGQWIYCYANNSWIAGFGIRSGQEALVTTPRTDSILLLLGLSLQMGPGELLLAIHCLRSSRLLKKLPVDVIVAYLLLQTTGPIATLPADDGQNNNSEVCQETKAGQNDAIRPAKVNCVSCHLGHWLPVVPRRVISLAGRH